MNARDLLAEMPAWPALMNAETGALYLGISVASFQNLMRRARVRPVDMGMSLVRWRRSDLDVLVTSLPTRGAANDDDVPELDFNAALELSSRRAAKVRQSRPIP